jgi:hypothetical protein
MLVNKIKRKRFSYAQKIYTHGNVNRELIQNNCLLLDILFIKTIDNDFFHKHSRILYI